MAFKSEWPESRALITVRPTAVVDSRFTFQGGAEAVEEPARWWRALKIAGKRPSEHPHEQRPISNTHIFCHPRFSDASFCICSKNIKNKARCNVLLKCLNKPKKCAHSCRGKNKSKNRHDVNMQKIQKYSYIVPLFISFAICYTGYFKGGWMETELVRQHFFFLFPSEHFISSFDNDTSQRWDLNAIRLHNTANSYLLWLWLTVNFATKSGPPKM